MVVASWTEPNAMWRFDLPEGQRDLSQDLAISLRAAVNPLSELNTPDLPQEFSIQLTDREGNTAIASTALNEPALQFPMGLTMERRNFGRSSLYRSDTVNHNSDAAEPIQWCKSKEYSGNSFNFRQNNPRLPICSGY